MEQDHKDRAREPGVAREHAGPATDAATDQGAEMALVEDGVADAAMNQDAVPSHIFAATRAVEIETKN